MATYRLIDIEKLNNLFGGIANKIRSVTGKNNRIEVSLNNEYSNPSITEEIDRMSETITHNTIADFVALNSQTIKTLIIKNGNIRSGALNNVGIENICFENLIKISGYRFFEDNDVKCVRFKNLTEIGQDVFNQASGLEKLIIETPLTSPDDETPPCTLFDLGALSGTMIESWYDNTGVYVPADAVSLYENDSNWCCFPIFPIPSKEEDPEGYYDLYGAFEEMEAVLC